MIVYAFHIGRMECLYTPDEVAAIGHAHGADGKIHWPPRYWGNRRLAEHPADEDYSRGYRIGRRSLRRSDMVP